MADSVLSKTDFPLYTVQAIGDRHFIVAGGGGPVKTGISNAIEIFQLKQVQNKLIASSLCRHDTGTQATMNSAVIDQGRNCCLAVGLDNECHIFSVKFKVVTPTKQGDQPNNETVRSRKEKKSQTKQNSDTTKQVTFDIQKLNEVKSDFSKDGGFQKAVRFFPSGSLLATGGADGHLRVWELPDLKKKLDIAAMKCEIDDLDVSPPGDRVVTVGKDSAIAWDAKDGKKIKDLVFPPSRNEPYRCRACRYGLVENKKDKFNLYTINIPCKRSTKPSPCYITMWDSSDFSVKKISNAGTEVLSALAISNDGIFIGVGTLSGSVHVYISFSLRKLHSVTEAHSIFVTGLNFLPSSEATRELTGGQEFTLLSISADNTVRYHQLKPRSEFNALWIVVGLLLIILAVFFLLDIVGV